MYYILNRTTQSFPRKEDWMSVLLVTHLAHDPERYRNDPPLPFELEREADRLVELVMEFHEANDPLGAGIRILEHGEGRRYVAVFKRIRERTGFRYANFRREKVPMDIIAGFSWMLGAAASRRSADGDLVHVGEDLHHHREHCQMLKDCLDVVSGGKGEDLAWTYVQKRDEAADQIAQGARVIFCAGRQLLTALGKKKDFHIASAYCLDWRTREAKCVIRNGVLLGK